MEKEKLKLEIELVPRTCWEVSLFHRMSRYRWNKLRKQILSESDDVCQICGESDGRLFCHEIWDYDDENYVRKLNGMIILCFMCHSVNHLGLTGSLSAKGNIKGTIEDVIKHFLQVNRTSRDIFEAHRANAMAIWGGALEARLDD